MRFSRHWWLQRGFAVVAVTAVTGGIAQQLLKQTLAPHELREGDVPPAIIWEPPALPHHSVNFESPEERYLRVVVVTKGLQQPWSLAFLPDGSMLVTERLGRPRIVRDGMLSPSPVADVPAGW